LFTSRDTATAFRHARRVKWTYILIAHGTVRSMSELPGFLLEIRRGRAVPQTLLDEMQQRYAKIGQSPLLEHTHRQAQALAHISSVDCRVAMRLWEPRLLDVISDLDASDGICLIPMAPFSVPIYEEAARRELAKLPDERRPHCVCVEAWGTHPLVIDEYVAGIESTLLAAFGRVDPEGVEVILTAHSLPNVVIRAGDPYAELFSATARLIEARLSVGVVSCYQSQGADGADWLGPGLSETLQSCADRRIKQVVVAPIGFLAEHVETLYDLDIEAQSEALKLGLDLVRVPTLQDAPGLIRALHALANEAVGRDVP